MEEEDIILLMQEKARQQQPLLQTIKQFYKDWLETIPEGITEPKSLEVTEEGREIRFPNPLMAITIYNNGPNVVWRGINTKMELLPIRVGTTSTVKTKKPKINYVWLICGKGEKAQVDIDTVR